MNNISYKFKITLVGPAAFALVMFNCPISSANEHGSAEHHESNHQEEASDSTSHSAHESERSEVSASRHAEESTHKIAHENDDDSASSNQEASEEIQASSHLEHHPAEQVEKHSTEPASEHQETAQGINIKKNEFLDDFNSERKFENEAHEDSLFSRVFHIVSKYEYAASTFRKKVDRFYSTEKMNKELEVANAKLRLETAKMRFDCRAEVDREKTRKFQLKLDLETGDRAGRTLASINYKPPNHLGPDQLYTLGVSYFRAFENEKAAVIFTYLTGLQKNDIYKTPKNYVLAGVAWYRLDNLELADLYFAKAIEQKADVDSLKYQAQARLWKALAAKRLRQPVKSQFWLKDLVDNHPRSTEAQWVNSSRR